MTLKISITVMWTGRKFDSSGFDVTGVAELLSVAVCPGSAYLYSVVLYCHCTQIRNCFFVKDAL